MRANETAAQQYLLELESSVRSGGLRESSSEPVFDAGREGLEFFRSFGPVYARYRGRDFDFKRDFTDKYDAQREIGFAHLRADADRLRELHGAMSETTVDFRNSAGPLFGAWRGKAADQAQGNLDALVSAAGSAGSRIGELAGAIDAVVEAAARITVSKAKFVRDLAAEDVGGLSSSDVEVLVTAADQGENPTNELLAELAKLCHVQADPKVCRTDKNLLHAVANDVSGWLDHVFAPFYEARQEAFDAVCAEAAANFAAAWDLLREALNGMVSEHEKAAEPVGGGQRTAPTANTAPPPAPVAVPAAGSPAAGAPAAGAPAAGAPAAGSGGEAVPPVGGAGDTPGGAGDVGGTGDGGGAGDVGGTGDGGGAGSAGGAGGVGGAGDVGGTGDVGGAGGVGGTGDVGGAGDRLEPGVETGAGETGMTGGVPAAPPSGGGSAPSSDQSAGQPGYQGFYYPATGFGGASGAGGERERRRSLPLAGEAVFDGPGDSAQASSFVIGGGDDETRYNDEDADALVESERPKPKPKSKDDLDEEDLW